MSNEIIKKFSAEVLGPKKLRICALGGSSDHGIKMIHLGVIDNGPGNVEEARKLIIDLTRELVCRYNSNSEIKPYLITYPFTDLNFFVDISYVNSKGGFWINEKGIDPKKQLASAMLSDGSISYYINPKKEMCPLEIVHTESFADALRIVNGDN